MNYIQYKGPWTKGTTYFEKGKVYTHIGIHINHYYSDIYDDTSFDNEEDPVPVVVELRFEGGGIHRFAIGKTGILEIDDCRCFLFTIFLNKNIDKIEGFIEVEVENNDG